MKKYFFFALVTAGMLSSCSSDDSVVAGSEGENEALVPIQIGIGGVTSVDETRGTGTVGGYNGDAANKWNKQQFNVYMLNKGTVDVATFKLTPTSSPIAIFDNEPFIAPDGETSGVAKAADDSVKYYPITGNYDFYAYYLGNQTNAAAPTKSADGKKLNVHFEIDGSQDIMVAKAVPTKGDSTALKNAGNTACDRYYSSFAARNAVQPNLSFRHLLTRLTFQVVPKMASNIVVDSIKVFTKKTSGTLTIAAVGDSKGNSQKITWDESAEPVGLALKERQEGKVELQKLTPIALEGKTVDTVISVGEALIVPGGESDYLLKVYTHQSIKRGTETETFNYVYEDKIVKPSGSSKTFGTAYSFNVKISLWGITDIKLTTELNGWNNVTAFDIPFEPEATR